MGISSKRVAPPLVETSFRQGPFAPPELPGFVATMNPSDSRPSQTAVMFFRSLSDGFPHESLRPVGSLRFLIDLSLPAVLFHPGEPGRRACSLLGDR